jgi:hypothetical protein
MVEGTFLLDEQQGVSAKTRLVSLSEKIVDSVVGHFL